MVLPVVAAGLVSCLAGMYGEGGLVPWCKTDRID